MRRKICLILTSNQQICLNTGHCRGLYDGLDTTQGACKCQRTKHYAPSSSSPSLCSQFQIFGKIRSFKVKVSIPWFQVPRVSGKLFSHPTTHILVLMCRGSPEFDVCSSVCLSVRLSVCPSVCPSVCLSRFFDRFDSRSQPIWCNYINMT